MAEPPPAWRPSPALKLFVGCLLIAVALVVLLLGSCALLLGLGSGLHGGSIGGPLVALGGLGLIGVCVWLIYFGVRNLRDGNAPRR